MLVALSEIFNYDSNHKRYSKEALLQLEIKTEFVKCLATDLKLFYLEDGNFENNLCYAFSREVKLDYKLSLSKSDIRNYLKATLQSIEYNIETHTVFFSQPIHK